MDPCVDTRYGKLRGRAEAGIHVFRGVPYARPPVAARRLCPPEPPCAWAGVRDAARFGPPPPQVPGPLARLVNGEAGSEAAEDCLTLNVYTPALGSGRRPVMVWIHGGGFTTGSGGSPVYAGTELARRGDLVVVTLNYRLGALGFLALPALTREDGGSAGHLGLLDQCLALEWVRDHIEAFGGDPSAVTLFGESAGAMSIGALLGVPQARRLFHRAVLQSGAAHNVSTPEQGERVAETFMRELGLAPDDVRRLRAAPVAAILEAQTRTVAVLWRQISGLAFQPVCDGRWMPRPPLEAVARGEVAHLPLLVGTNLDEYKLYRPTDPKVDQLDEAALIRRLTHHLPGGQETARAAVRAYRAARRDRAPGDAPELWFAIETDRLFRIPALRLVEAQLRHQRRSFVYLFTWPSPALGGRLGSCHAVEIPFVFGTHRRPELEVLVGKGEAVERLSVAVQDAWIGFARDADPRHSGLPGWTAYRADHRPTQLLGAECRVEADPAGAERRFWEGIL